MTSETHFIIYYKDMQKPASPNADPALHVLLYNHVIYLGDRQTHWRQAWLVPENSGPEDQVNHDSLVLATEANTYVIGFEIQGLLIQLPKYISNILPSHHLQCAIHPLSCPDHAFRLLLSLLVSLLYL